jgi:hypothetical protein
MATIASRISANGTLLLNGNFDEVTFNNTTPVIKNIYKYSQDFTNAYWQKGGPVTVTATTATLAPDGSSTAQLVTVGGTGTFPYIRVAGGGAVVPATLDTIYTVSAYVKYINQRYMTIVNEDGWTSGLSVRFDLLTNTVGTLGAKISSASITPVSDGWVRLSATFIPIPSGINYWNPQAVRIGGYDGNNYSGSQVYVWGAQLEANTTATIYQGIGATNTLVTPTFKTKTAIDSIYSTGVYDEVTYSSTAPVIKNLLNNTEAFEFWGNSANNVTTNVTTAPNGTLTADRIQVDNAGYTATLNVPTISGVSYVFSFFVKSVSGVTGTWPVNYYTGAHNRSTVPITGQWARQYITFTGTGGLVNVYVADNRSLLANINDGYVWGAQLEVGTTPTIYQGIGATNTLLTPGFAKREDTSGNLYVTGSFDEVTGMIVTNGLLLQYDPGKLESYRQTGSQIVDISGNGRDSTIVGAVTYDALTDSLLFDSPIVTTDNRITLNTSIVFADGAEYSVEFWCKLDSGAGQTYQSIAGTSSTAPWIGIRKGATDYQMYFRQTGGTYFYSTSIPTAVLAGWAQVVFSVNTSKVVTYYVNYATGSYTDTDTLANSTLTISRLAAGYSSGGNFYAFDGNVGPINVYNKVLSAAEVTSNFEALRGRFGI